MTFRVKTVAPVALIILLALVSIIGFGFETKGGSPLRVYFNTKGGNVIFNHRGHIENYESDCKKCHHETDKKEWDCRSCHRSGTDTDSICDGSGIHKQCIGKNCVNCHTNMSGLDGENCSFCHK